MNFELYKIKCREIEEKLEILKAIAEEEQTDNTVRNIKDIMSKLQKDDFKVMVVGEFSRGKSTFVNALLGKALLPASNVPTTAVITKVIYDENTKVHVYQSYDTKEYQELSVDEFVKIRAPKERFSEEEKEELNSKIKQIAMAEIYYPLELCKNKVEIIDSPGLNDTDMDRVELTLNYMKNADTAIVLLAANQTLTESEQQFIDHLVNGEQIRDIFFVLNFKDQANGEEERVIKYLRENILAKNPSLNLLNKIFIVNSKGALIYKRNAAGEEIKASTLNKFLPENIECTGFPELEMKLKNFLLNEKGTVRLKKYVGLMEAVVNSLIKIMNNKQSILLDKYEQVVEKVAYLEPKFLEAKNETDRLVEEYKGKANYKMDELASKVRGYKTDTLSFMNKTIDDLDDDELTDSNLNKVLEIILADKVESLKADIEHIQNDDIAVLREEYYQKLLRIWKNIDRECRATLGSNNTNLPMTQIQEGNVSIYTGGIDAASTKEKEDLAGLLIGGGIGLAIAGMSLLPIIAIGAVIAHFFGLFNSGINRGKIKREVSSTIEKYFKDLEGKIEENYRNFVALEVDNMTVGFKDKIVELEAQLNKALEEKKSTKHNTDTLIAKINKKISDISQARIIGHKILEEIQ